MARRDDPDLTRVAVIDPWMGQVVAGRYRLELRIAAGGFGAIYRALDLHADRDVAIKLLHPSLTQDPAVIARFKREGAALATLRDPHTVIAYEVGETEDGTLFIAMELLQGDNLYRTFREQGPMHWRRVAAIARSVCSSLAEAHALGIVHRDLKPANIHLEGDDRNFVKVLDFGIAKIIGGSLEQSDLTNAGQMIGTFDYMPPEQMVGGETSGKSDMFTLGVVMYELLVGERPFGDPATAGQMLAALLSYRPSSPAARGAEVPPDLDRAIMRCLSQHPTERPSATELAAAIDQLLGHAHERPSRSTTAVDAEATQALAGTTMRMERVDGGDSVSPGDARRSLDRTDISFDRFDTSLERAEMTTPDGAALADDTVIESRDPIPASSAAEGRRGSIESRDPIPASSAAEGRRGSNAPNSRPKFLPFTTLPGVAPPKKPR